MTPDEARQFREDGVIVLPGFAGPDLVAELREEFDRIAGAALATDRQKAVAGIRGALGKSDRLRQLAQGGAFLAVAQRVLDQWAVPVRGLLFDKTERANWPLPWHQDKVAALAGTARPASFTNWTTKQGVTHAELPLAFLLRMATLRLHLDTCDGETGALTVLPGVHDQKHPETWLREQGPARGIELPVNEGDLVVIRPLTPHASRMVTRPCRRRVIHVEYCAKELPEGLAWEEAA